MENYNSKNLQDFDLVAPAATQSIPTTAGRITIQSLLDLIGANCDLYVTLAHHFASGDLNTEDFGGMPEGVGNAQFQAWIQDSTNQASIMNSALWWAWQAERSVSDPRNNIFLNVVGGGLAKITAVRNTAGKVTLNVEEVSI